MRRNFLKSGAPLLLDLYPGATSGLSLRYLKSSFVGNEVVLLQRTSNNDEDGFTPNQITNGSAVSFCGAGGGLIKTLFDQTGNNKNGFQVASTNQPSLVEGGVLNLLNGKPNMKFNSSDYLAIDIATIATYYIFNVLEINPATLSTIMYGSSTNSTDFYWAAQDGSTLTSRLSNCVQNNLFIDGVSSTPATRGAQYLLTDSQAIHTADINFSFSASDDFTIGYIVGSGTRSYKTQEVIIYPTSQSANRVAIETNQANYYGITL
tara:strand:+ start:8969 stop:9757 length:789 start_codon:yes stop_codon:yes gene_type:complete